VSGIEARARVDEWLSIHAPDGAVDADVYELLVDGEEFAIEAEKREKVAAEADRRGTIDICDATDAEVDRWMRGPNVSESTREIVANTRSIEAHTRALETERKELERKNAPARAAAREAGLWTPITPHDECVPWDDAHPFGATVADHKRVFQRGMVKALSA
jgi:hypothetical protein